MEKAGQQHLSVAQLKHEQDQSLAELDGHGRPHELFDANARSELEGAYRS